MVSNVDAPGLRAAEDWAPGNLSRGIGYRLQRDSTRLQPMAENGLDGLRDLRIVVVVLWFRFVIHVCRHVLPLPHLRHLRPDIVPFEAFAGAWWLLIWDSPSAGWHLGVDHGRAPRRSGDVRGYEEPGLRGY